jgi:tetratricopeptide (TPR) repeat protein
VEVALERKLLPQSHLTFDQTQTLARALDLLGVVFEKQGEFDDAIAKIEQANDLWEGFRAESELLASTSQQSSILRRNVAEQGQGDFVDVKIGLAQFYTWKGGELQQNNRSPEANTLFTKAEDLLLEVLKYFAPEWPNHLTTGLAYFRLGQTYASWNERTADAEPAYRHALAIYEAVEGRRGDQVKFIVQTLADFLRKQGRADGAQQLEDQYKT